MNQDDINDLMSNRRIVAKCKACGELTELRGDWICEECLDFTDQELESPRKD